jgi:hypothetical protein
MAQRMFRVQCECHHITLMTGLLERIRQQPFLPQRWSSSLYPVLRKYPQDMTTIYMVTRLKRMVHLLSTLRGLPTSTSRFQPDLARIQVWLCFPSTRHCTLELD